MKLALVCSSGGHFLQLYLLKELWKDYERIWVTFPGNDTEYFLSGEKVCWGYFPTNRNPINFFKNLILALQILSKERPDAVLSTGAGISVPFIFIAKIFRIKTIYIESLTRIDELSLSARLVYGVADHMFVRWPELAARYKKTEYKG
jgi:UDP-N-acetylglucosamine:LPS N-acetylglucosamine transferase